jgi:hypothetical protein
VATSRNDDHGAHLVERMQWFVDGLAWNAARSGAATELIMVEWNPPAERPPLAEVLRWPGASGTFSVRVVTVPADEHRRLVGEGGIPMMQMIAKNVGIRRARGANVLATNIDILLAPSLFDLAASKIGEGALWRADRCDVEFPFDPDVTTIEQAYEFCGSHPLRFERRDGIYYPGVGRRLPIYQGVGDFVGWQARQAGHALRHLARVAGSGRGRSADEAGAAETSEPPTLTRHRPSDPRSIGGLARFAADRAMAVADLAVLPKLNVNACGDFTVLAAKDWDRLRGYPEWVVHSLHLDTIFMHQAHAAGLSFVDVDPPSVAYHMEHSAGSGWTPEAQEQHLASVARRGMPHITPARLRQEKRTLLAASRRHTPVLYNDTQWGLADTSVVEWSPPATEVSAPRRPRRRPQTGSDRSTGTATTS